MGSVHAPDAPDVKVVDVVVSEGVMVACIVQLPNTVLKSFVLAAIHFVSFEEVVTTVDLNCANNPVVSDLPVMGSSAGAVASPSIETQSEFRIAIQGQIPNDPMLRSVLIEDGRTYPTINCDSFIHIVGESNGLILFAGSMNPNAFVVGATSYADHITGINDIGSFLDGLKWLICRARVRVRTLWGDVKGALGVSEG
jgi:hypothetical protein